MGVCAINTINNHQYNPNFAQKKSQDKKVEQADANPISRKGEIANLVKATFVGGLILAGKLFWELTWDGDFVFDDIAKKAGELVDKNKKEAAENKKFLYKLGAFVSLMAAAFAGFALLYTAYKAPKIAYQSKVNTFTKSQEMDVYTKSNDAERELYTQLAEKAKDASPEEKEALKEQYLKMRMAKNQVPDFVKQKKSHQIKNN